MRTYSVVLPIAMSALVSPVMHAANALPNSADIAVESDLVHMTLSISQEAGGGCSGGFAFQGAWGGCVRESIDTEAESRACADGTSGVQTRQRSRTRYTHQNGSVRHGAYGAWSGWSGACTALPQPTAPESPDPAPGAPQVGTTYFVDAWICDSTNSNYAFPAGPSNSNRNKLIATYKGFNFYGRCPERLGYSFWIEQWNAAAQAYAGQHNTPLGMAYDVTFNLAGTGIKKRMLDGAMQRGEHLATIIGTMDAECQKVADSNYGAGRITAVYDAGGNGSRCKVVRVN